MNSRVNSRGSSVVIFFLIFTLFASVIISDSIVQGAKSSFGSLNKSCIAVTQKSRVKTDSFEIKDIDDLRSRYKRVNVLGLGESQSDLQYGERKEMARIVGISGDIRNFKTTYMEEGSFLNEEVTDVNSNYAVIDRNLAFKLFGSTKALGLRIKLQGRSFYISGVVKDTQGVRRSISDDGLSNVYIPLKCFLNLYSENGITHMEFSSTDGTDTDIDKDKVRGWIRLLGKDDTEYQITDYAEKNKLIAQSPEIICMMLGILSCCMLLGGLKKQFSDIVSIYRRQKDKNYAYQIFKGNYRLFSKKIGVAAAILLVIAFILAITLQSIYIPPRYIPDEIIDLSYYEGLIKTSIRDGINSALWSIPHRELEIMRMGTSQALLTLLAVMDAVFIALGLRNILVEEYLNKGSVEFILLISSAASVIISIGLLYFMKLPAYVNIKHVTAMWLFLFCIFLNGIMRKRC